MPRFPFHVSPPGAGRILIGAVSFAALCVLAVVLAPLQSVGAVVLAQTDIAPIIQAQAEAAANVIWNDSALRLICIAGSIGGSILSILLFPPASARAMAGKMTASVIAGALFTPILIRWVDIVPDADVLLCGAAVVSLLSWSILMAAVPIVQNFARKWLQVKFPEDKDDDKEGRS